MGGARKFFTWGQSKKYLLRGDLCKGVGPTHKGEGPNTRSSKTMCAFSFWTVGINL